MTASERERVETVVIGGGQAGLSVGYHLARRDLPFVILDANDRIGDAWRHRWASLRLFTPARHDGLDGMAFPAPGATYPTKDEMADYLQAYADRFDLPVRLGVEVDRLSYDGTRFRVAAGERVIEADNVVVAVGTDQRGRIPAYAPQLAADIVQLHSVDYRRPSQLKDGDVLVVGAANSGVEIALDVAGGRRVWLSGRHPGHVPIDIDGVAYRYVLSRLVLRVLFHRVLTVDTAIGRRARRHVDRLRTTVVRTRPRDLGAAGIERVARVSGVRDGLPLLTDGRVLEVANVIWCTGYHPGFSWVDLDVFEGQEPRHRSGLVDELPGLYFVGLDFLHSVSSGMVHGVGRDAARVADAIATRMATRPHASPDASIPSAI
ncbi:MAG: NAD(P)/FAD-dependent oxidoreductase [Actinobacteria bacterium]|nr:NAD(P)/FAD-dependent oxidoreductase [Actinomycetota bacterium]